MELLIAGLGAVLLLVVGLSFVFTAQDSRKAKAESSATSRVAELEAGLGRKDEELQKSLSEAQRLEEEFAEAKNDADAIRRELSGLTAYVAQAQKGQEELAKAAQELKEKNEALALEAAAREKLQQDLALAAAGREKLQQDLTVEAEARQKLQQDFVLEASARQKLQENLAQRDKALEERSKRAAELEAELTEAQKKLEAGAGADKALQGRVAELEAELAEAQKKLAAGVGKGQALQGRVAVLEGQLAEANKKLEAGADADKAFQERMAEVKAQLAQQDEALRKALDESGGFEKAYYEAKSELDNARKECSELTIRLRQAQHVTDELVPFQEELEQTKAALEQQSVLRLQLKDELTQAQLALREASRKTQKLGQELRDAQEQVKAGTRQNETLTQQVDTLKIELRRAQQAALEPPKPLPAPPKPPSKKEAAPETKPHPLKKPVTRPLDKHDKRIGEILIAHKFITKEELAKALDFQEKYGGNVTQYLLYFGYIDEKELAQCLSEQFRVPYLPLGSYTITEEAIAAIPVDIAEKYWVMPVETMRNALVVAMIDPLDETVIRELTQLTGLEVIPFVAIISDIVTAHQIYYYKTFSKDDAFRLMKVPVFLIKTSSYTGMERRQSIRYSTRIDIRYPLHGRYVTSQTLDVSRGGFAFLSEEAMEPRTVLTLEVVLPAEVTSLPVSAVVEVVRCIPRSAGRYQIGARTLKISKEDTNLIVSYASKHQELT